MGFEPTTLGATGGDSGVGLCAFNRLGGPKSVLAGIFGQLRKPLCNRLCNRRTHEELCCVAASVC